MRTVLAVGELLSGLILLVLVACACLGVLPPSMLLIPIAADFGGRWCASGALMLAEMRRDRLHAERRAQAKARPCIACGQTGTLKVGYRECVDCASDTRPPPSTPAA